MSRHVVINGRELSMNDAGFIDPNSEWSVTVGEDGSFEVNRLDLKAENEKLRELFAELWPIAEYAGDQRELRRARELIRELGIEVDE